MRTILASTLALGLAAPMPSTAQSLPALNIDRNAITVSGVSSGGYMAVQMHVAHSRTFAGVGSIAGGPYYCAENTLAIALSRCMLPDAYDEPDPARLAWITRMFADDGRIDPVDGLLDDRVWIFSSPGDTVVRQRVSDRLVDYYRQFVDASRIEYVSDVGGEHSMPTDGFGFACSYKGSSTRAGDHFINDCDYDAAGAMLAHLQRRLRRPVSASEASLVAFDQAQYLASPTAHSLGTTGYAYVPAACASGARCALHVAFHGCLQGASRIGETFVRHAGYNRWAEGNRIVVLYPQATAAPQQGNGNGCWDWWGYDDAHYMQRDGRQVQAVMRMVDRIASTDAAAPAPPAPGVPEATVSLDGALMLAWPRVDDPRVVGYTVFRGRTALGPFLQVGADVVAEPSLVLAEPGVGTQHFVVVAVTADGQESASSPALAVALPGL
jgi:poly(3-hydroxybutyrate) depolymerase